MKCLFTLILGITSLLGISQGNIVDANKVWSYTYLGNSNDDLPSMPSFEDKIGSDTIINSDTFYNVIYKRYDLEEWVKSYFYLREDGQKVYLITIINGVITNQGLLYDFSINVGDTTYLINNECDSTEMTLEKIETVNINGFSHQQYKYVSTNISLPIEDMYAIPNIGSRSGLISSFNCIVDGGGSMLLCVHELGNQIYDNTQVSDGNCYIEGSNTINEKAFINTSVIINGNNILISSDEFIKSVKTLNSIGQTLGIYKSNSKEVKISNPNANFLLFQIEYQNGIREVKRLVNFM